MEIIKLLDKLEDIIDEASKVPLSNKIMVEKNEIIEIISEIRIELPDEIKQASWMQKERERILGEAEDEAQKVLNEAYKKQQLLIDEHEVLDLAKKNAKEILENARRDAFEINSSTKEHCGRMLQKTEAGLNRMLEVLYENIEEINEM